ncbi:MAG TPA: ABC transporter permease [Spirochaetaceae bacterium]|jgi:peptide/nickel transport system permease protein|nr:ABC transporter permease [Spirochaetaceae bacterium]
MSLKDTAYRFKEFWDDFRREKAGLVGLGILLFCLLVVIFEPVFLPYKDVNGNWRNISYWEDNTRAAPPVWTNLFSAKKSAVTVQIDEALVKEEFTKSERYPAGIDMRVYSFEYEYKYDLAPVDIILRTVADGNINMDIDVIRPDGQVVYVGSYTESGMQNTSLRFSIDTEGRSNVMNFVRERSSEFGINMSNTIGVRPTNIIFSELASDMFRARTPLKGTYTIRAKVPMTTLNVAGNNVDDVMLVVSGRVSGILGTDTSKRDLFSGIIAGLKWALFIGLITSIISVLIGVMYGIISAYFGGFVDTSMSFIWEIFVSVPVLPVLIVMSAIFKPSIWIIIASLIVFSWVGPVKTVRSMALQMKEETYIEAAKALGAGKWRIIFKHLAPLLLPYSFANMALAVPSTIIFEASLSLLGLGDPTIITWGQILHDAQSSGATLNGLWWWIVPPGLFIAVMGMTFAFLGFAMDKILHPKLRTR